MRTAIILFSLLLLLWIAGSSYMYVCKIRKDCCFEQTADKAPKATDKAIEGFTDTLRAVTAVPKIQVPPVYIIYFDLNKSVCEITAENTSHFGLIKQYLTANAGKRVRVTGHSDSMGPQWIKDIISAQRADFVKQKLIEAGIASVLIEITAESDRKQAMDNNTKEGRAKNRRTEILIQ